MDLYLNLAQSPLRGSDRRRWCDLASLALAAAGYAVTVRPTPGRDRLGREPVPAEVLAIVDKVYVPLEVGT